MLEEIGIRGEAKPQRGRGRRLDRHRVGDPAKVSALGRFAREIRQVTPDRRKLPCETFVRFHPLEPGEQSVHQSGDDVGTERQARAVLPVVLAFDPGPLQKGSVRQDIG